jgi:hypothetical protein
LKHVFFDDKWVRFHTLPESKRYPENEAEDQIVLSRHNEILQHLITDDLIRVFTVDWSPTPEPPVESSKEIRAVDSDAEYWQTVPSDPTEKDPKFQTYTHVYTSIRPWRWGSVDALLCSVAADELAGVIVAPMNLEWLYHPYDGGMDVILPDEASRDQLKVRYAGWLSSHELGL